MEQNHAGTPSRVPPHNLEAERSVLGGLLIKPAASAEVASVLEVDDFFLPAHREIYEVMLHVEGRNEPIDPLVVADELRARGVLAKLDGAEEYLLKMTGAVPTAENIGHYAKIVREKAALRRLIASCADTMSRAYQDLAPFDELADDHRAQVDKIVAAPDSGPQRIGELLNTVLDDLEMRQVNPERHAITTGLAELNEMLGGYFPGDLVVVAGRPSSGKTAYVLNGAVRAAMEDGTPFLIFSMEMSKLQMTQRSLAFVAKVTNDDIRRAKVQSADWTKLDQVGRPKLRDIPLDLDDREDMTFESMRATAIRWALGVDPDALAKDKKLRRPKAIVVDSMSLMRKARPGRSRVEDVGYMSRGLKKLARFLDCPVILIVHLSRDVEKGGRGGKQRRPRMSDLREAGNIEQDADVILFPHRTVAASSKGPVEVTIIVEKNRNGAVGDVLASWDARYMAFGEAIDERDYDGPSLPGVGG